MNRQNKDSFQRQRDLDVNESLRENSESQFELAYDLPYKHSSHSSFRKSIPAATPEQSDSPFVKRDSCSILTAANTEASPPEVRQDKLDRALKPWQVQMIAIGGTIGTGLFLGTGGSLATGGPGSLLIAYLICGGLVYLTMLCLGEMASYIPVAGSFTTYTSRFVDEAWGFALTWNYWFNDACSVAGDLTALQMLIGWWGLKVTWPFSLLMLLLAISANMFGVAVYGHVEYFLSLVKVIIILIFILIGIIVNCGGNMQHHYVGFENWHHGSAPFVGGIGGFASVFVTAAFSFGGTESIGVTAGETRNPRRNMPRVIKNVFWRVMMFYVMGTFVVGLDVPYDTPGLKDSDVSVSPFTLVFELAGFKVAAHMMNAVILTSVASAANHALFAGTRLMYALAAENHAPHIFTKLNRTKTPLFALFATSLISCVCFASSYIGAGKLWDWIQKIVGVSNQLAWVFIGLSAWRFRKALEVQGKDVADLPFVNPFRKWAPQVVFFANIFIIIVQGWKSFVPSQSPNGKFSFANFISYYLEVPVLVVMYAGFKWYKKTKVVPLGTMELEVDRYVDTAEDVEENEGKKARWWQWIV